MADVLVVDDDQVVRDVVVSYLRADGHSVTEAADGQSALATLDERLPDLVVLDVKLPGIDGLDVCRRLPDEVKVQIIILSALAEEADRVVGLESSADDYVTKPFSPRELVLRVNSVLRRFGVPRDPSRPIGDGDLVVHLGQHLATRAGEPLHLTSREFDLLHFLLTPPPWHGRATRCCGRYGDGLSATRRPSPSTSDACAKRSRTTRPGRGDS